MTAGKSLPSEGAKDNAGGGGGGDKLQEFEIFFDDPLGAYTSGDEITGRLSIVLREPMKMRILQLQFKGVTRIAHPDEAIENLYANDKREKMAEKRKKVPTAPVASETPGVILGKNSVVAVAVPETTTVHGVEPAQRPMREFMRQIVHLDTTLDLLERRPGQEVPHDFALLAGRNWLPFSFPLPKRALPASLESPGASVRYWCRAIICKPWKHNRMAKRAFTVLPPCAGASSLQKTNKEGFYDCRLATESSFPLFWRPVNKDQTAECKSCCFTGKASCEVSMPRQVFNLGDQLAFSVKITNASRRQVQRIHLTLVQLVTCRTSPGDAKGDPMMSYVRHVWEQTVERPFAKEGGGAWSGDFHAPLPAVCPTMEMDDDTARKSGVVLRVAYQLRCLVYMDNRKHKPLLAVHIPVALVGAPYVTHAQKASGRSTADQKHQSQAANIRACHFGPVSIVDFEDAQFLRGAVDFTPLYPSVS